MQKLNPNSTKAIKLYAQFIIEILNDKEGGNEYLSYSKDYSNLKTIKLEGNNPVDGSACIIASGLPNKIGIITTMNSGAERIIGYTKLEIENRHINIIIPEIF